MRASPTPKVLDDPEVLALIEYKRSNRAKVPMPFWSAAAS